ncbi:hypothetical protein X975_22622, partial [Stegodyphus mimosarum]
MQVYCPLSLALILRNSITEESSSNCTDTFPEATKGKPFFSHLNLIGGSPVVTLHIIFALSPSLAVTVSGKYRASITGA